jgi:CheY-like chemotaxis protein
MTVDRRARVLVIDDDDDLRMLIAAVLEAEGYSVDVAADGAEGLASVEHALPDVVVLDMKMPRMDGPTFARELHRQYGHRAKVLVLTAADDARRRAEEVNADGWLGKPFDLDALVAAVRKQAS